jgi:hypothetical protein
VILALASASDLAGHVVSSSVSRSLLERHGVRHEPLDEDLFAREPEACIGELVSRLQPAIVVSGSSPARGAAPETPEQYLLLEARRAGISSVGILDNWGRYIERFSAGENGVEPMFLPDRLCVLDRRCFNDLISLGAPAENLAITHNPWVDQFVELADARLVSEDESARGLRIIFASQPLAETRHIRHWLFTQDSLFDGLLAALPSLPPGRSHEVTIWPHPAEHEGRWASHRCQRTDVLVLVLEERGSDALAGADLFVTSHSTAAYEALYHGVPCVSFRPEGGTLGTPLIEELGLSSRLEDGNALRRFLASFDPRRHRRALREQRQALSADGLFFSDGRATERVVAEIRSVIRRRSGPRPN